MLYVQFMLPDDIENQVFVMARSHQTGHLVEIEDFFSFNGTLKRRGTADQEIGQVGNIFFSH